MHKTLLTRLALNDIEGFNYNDISKIREYTVTVYKQRLIPGHRSMWVPAKPNDLLLAGDEVVLRNKQQTRRLTVRNLLEWCQDEITISKEVGMPICTMAVFEEILTKGKFKFKQ